jgi:hypothetical protein
MDLTTLNLCYAAWLFGTDIEILLNVLQSRRAQMSKVEILELWLQFDQGVAPST